jgi:hypothetical protein
MRAGKQPGDVRAEVERLKKLPDPERRAAVEEIARPARDFLASLPRLLVDWEEVREMAANGIELGGHTVSHPILSALSGDALLNEVQNCKLTIERETGAEASAFAYPVGRAFAYHDAAVEAVKAAGYRFAVTTEYGRNPTPLADPFRLRRIGIGLEDLPPRFRAKLLAPRFFGPPALPY